VLQANVHAPAAHDAWAWATFVVHALPHAPQLLALLVVATHVVPHNVGVAAGHPEAHAYALPEPEHTGVAPAHAVLQPPHVAACDRSVSQPFETTPSQSAHPGAHADAVNAQTPAVHVVAPLTWASAVHSLPHAPQLPVSLVTSTHAPPHSV
jgi:hypothetical protein